MKIHKNNNILVLIKVSDPEKHIHENNISVNKLLSDTLLKHMDSNFLMRLGISSLSCISLYQIATAPDPLSLFFLIVCFIVYKDFEKIKSTDFNQKKFPNHHDLTAIINILEKPIKKILEEPTSLAELNFLRLSYRYFWLLKNVNWNTGELNNTDDESIKADCINLLNTCHHDAKSKFQEIIHYKKNKAGDQTSESKNILQQAITEMAGIIKSERDNIHKHIIRREMYIP
jgi:hypothetical protein